MLALNFSYGSIQIDFLLAALIGYFAYATNKAAVYRILSVIGLVLSSAEILFNIILNINDEYWVSNIYTIVFWIVMLVYFIRVIKGYDAVLCIKTLSAVPILIALYSIVQWFDLLPKLIVYGVSTDILMMLILCLPYVVYGALIRILILRHVKKNQTLLPKVSAKRKITVTAIALAILLLLVAFTPILVMGDVSSSLGTPFSIRQPGNSYYNDAFSAVRIERVYRSIIINSSDMVTEPRPLENVSKPFEEIRRDSLLALISWLVIAITLYYSFKLQKQRHMKNLSSFTTVVILWLCIAGVYIISTLTALFGFIYVPVSFVISGVIVTLIYKADVTKTLRAPAAAEEHFAENINAPLKTADAGIASNSAASVCIETAAVNEGPAKESDKYCYKCGHRLREGSLFCSECGADLK